MSPAMDIDDANDIAGHQFHQSPDLSESVSAPQRTPPPLSGKSSGASTLSTTKGKTRRQRVCQPCRLRKVKCTYERPCQVCVERGHPELCQYLPKPSFAKSLNINHGSSENSALVLELSAVHEKLADVNRSIRDLRDEVRSLRTGVDLHASTAVSIVNPVAGHSEEQSLIQGVSASNELGEGAVFLGGNSVPAMVVALSKNSNVDVGTQEVLGQSILPIFGLDNESVTYPFVDLWGLPHGSVRRLELLAKLLPNTDAECLRLFKHYQDLAHVIYPVVFDIAKFENEFLDFLTQRAADAVSSQSMNTSTQRIHQKDLHWIGLMFAILASGVLCSDLPRKDRQMKSQVFVCCAYECLRIVNYISRATITDIQTLLVLGNVISNNMNAGVAWTLLGITIRLAQSLGLHYDTGSYDLSAPQTAKSNVWWQIIWQDSLLSITYDRSSPSPVLSHIKSSKSSSALSYVEFMRRLCLIGLDIVRERASSQPTYRRLTRIMEHRDEILENVSHLEPHLTSVCNCKTMKDQLEYWNLYLHRSYILSELCRPSIQHLEDSQEHKELIQSIRSFCILSLANTVDAFLGLKNITNFATQSWAAVHRALSSALLLCILREPSRSTRVSGLVHELTSVMSDLVSSVDPTELSAPLTRSVEALRRLMTSEVGSPGTSTEYGPRLGSVYSEASAQSLSSSSDSPYSILDSIIWGQH